MFSDLEEDKPELSEEVASPSFRGGSMQGSGSWQPQAATFGGHLQDVDPV